MKGDWCDGKDFRRCCHECHGNRSPANRSTTEDPPVVGYDVPVGNSDGRQRMERDRSVRPQRSQRTLRRFPEREPEVPENTPRVVGSRYRPDENPSSMDRLDWKYPEQGTGSMDWQKICRRTKSTPRHHKVWQCCDQGDTPQRPAESPLAMGRQEEWCRKKNKT